MVAPGDGLAGQPSDVSSAADAVELLVIAYLPVRHAVGVARQHQAVEGRTGGTVNDVVMAICAGTYAPTSPSTTRRLTGRCGRWCPCPSARARRRTRGRTASGLVVDLPTHLADPLERVARVLEYMLEGKQRFELVPAEALIDIQQYAPPVVATSAIRLAAHALANRVDPVVNVIVSNVPGPRQPLYLGRAKLDQYIPVSTIGEGMGLNITVHTLPSTS